MPVAVILLSIVLMASMALALAVQRAIRALASRCPRRSELPAEARARTLILFGIYVRWLNVAFLLATAVYLIAARTSAWYYGVALVALCWIGSLLIGAMARLRPDSAEMAALLRSDLERRRAWYRAGQDTLRLHVVESLLECVRSAPRARATTPGLHR